MAVDVIGLTPTEQDAYNSSPEVREIVERVGLFVQDLHEEDEDVPLVLVLNDIDDPTNFGIAFAGSQLSLEFDSDFIQVCDFNDGDEEVLMAFPRDKIHEATLWLVNHLPE